MGLTLAFGFGEQDLLVAGVVVPLLLGGSKLAAFGRELGRGIRHIGNRRNRANSPGTWVAIVFVVVTIPLTLWGINQFFDAVVRH